MRAFQQGEVVKARGREWIVVCPPEGDVDLLIADPFFTEEEKQRMQRVDKVNEMKKSVIPSGVSIQRGVLDLTEIE